MECGEKFVVAEIKEAAMHILNRLAQAHAIERQIAQRDNNLRVDCFDLFFQECRMHFNFLWSQRPLFGHWVFDDVGKVGPARVDPRRAEQLIQEPHLLATHGLIFPLFLGTGHFSDQHNTSVSGALSQDEILSREFLFQCGMDLFEFMGFRHRIMCCLSYHILFNLARISSSREI